MEGTQNCSSESRLRNPTSDRTAAGEDRAFWALPHETPEKSRDTGAWGSEGSEDRAFWALLNETPEQSGGHRSLGVCGRPRGSHCTYQLFASQGLVFPVF